MNTLDNFTLQIISKYIYDFKTINNLLKLNKSQNINKSFSELYYTTFEIINLNCHYILTDKQVKNIVDKLINMFPNLEEIILNFNSNYDCITIDDFNNCVLANYLKFLKYTSNLGGGADLGLKDIEKPIKIKIQFDFKIKICTLGINHALSESQSTFNLNLYILSQMIKKEIIISKNIYIIFQRINQILLSLRS